MATFKDTVITTVGENLVTYCLANGVGLSFRQVKTSSNQYPDGTDFKALTDLTSIQQTVSVGQVVEIEPNTFKVIGTFLNAGVTSAYSIWAYGVYAYDPQTDTNILFSVTPSEAPADTMPPQTSGGATFIAQPQYSLSGDLEINAILDPAGLVTQADLDNYLPLAGGTMTGQIVQPLDPVEDTDLVNKKYVDENSGPDGNFVTLDTSQTITAPKTFTGNVLSQFFFQSTGSFILSGTQNLLNAGSWSSPARLDFNHSADYNSEINMNVYGAAGSSKIELRGTNSKVRLTELQNAAALGYNGDLSVDFDITGPNGNYLQKNSVGIPNASTLSDPEDTRNLLFTHIKVESSGIEAENKVARINYDQIGNRETVDLIHTGNIEPIILDVLEDDYVDTTSAQTVNGTKTFTDARGTTPDTSSPNDMLINKQYINTALAEYVTLDTPQSITGIKTFTTARGSTPVANNDFATKQYVDQNVPSTSDFVTINGDQTINATSGTKTFARGMRITGTVNNSTSGHYLVMTNIRIASTGAATNNPENANSGISILSGIPNIQGSGINNQILIGYNTTSYSGNGIVNIGTNNTTGDANYGLGNYNGVIGYNCKITGAGSAATGQTCYAIGASCSIVGAPNITGHFAIGANAQITATDTTRTMQLGGTGLSVLRSPVALTAPSDKRDKADIEKIYSGLDFINEISAVRYKRNDRTRYMEDTDDEEINKQRGLWGIYAYDKEAHAAGKLKGDRYRSGVLAQELKEAFKKVYDDDDYAALVNENFHGVDLTNLPDGAESQMTVEYTGLIPFLISAVQELSAESKKQADQIKNLSDEVEALKALIKEKLA